MFRITTLFLCILLTAAAVGRYRAEESVRKARSELEKLETSRLEELERIQILRAEIAYLDNPERLAKIARSETDLRPTSREQMVSQRQFAAAMTGETSPTPAEDAPVPSEAITNAIAMAQLAAGE